jgi:hypothetical protein
MSRRLFFLFPDTEHAQNVVNELNERGINTRYIHAIAKGVDLESLPEATERQKADTTFRLERFAWSANLMLFLVALIAFISSLVSAELLWALITLLIMLVTFIAGEQFVVRVPDVHLTEFTDALSHGEVLLMIDVPAHRVAEIEDYVHHRHPEACVGGVGWAIGAFDM